MNKIKLLFYMCCILKTLVTGKETPNCFSKISLNNQNKKDNNNKKNLFRALGCGAFTGLSPVGLQYKFPVFFEGYTQRLPNIIEGNYKKLFLTGLLTGAGLYTATSWILQKLKTDRKNKNDDQNGDQIKSFPQSSTNNENNSSLEETVKITMMPGYLKKYIKSIKETIFESSFFRVCSTVARINSSAITKIKLWQTTREEKYRSIVRGYAKDSELAARVFVMPDTQEIREEFEELVKTEHNGDLLDRYCDQKNQEQEGKRDMLDCCYILRISKEECSKIDSEQLQNSQINSCCFKLNKKIHKNDHEIRGAEFISFMKQETP